MSGNKAESKTRRAYKFIEAHSDEFSVKTMCQLLGVARAGYYTWLNDPVSDRAMEDASLFKLIRASFIASHGIYGAPRILQDLREREGRRAVSIEWRVSCGRMVFGHCTDTAYVISPYQNHLH